MPKKWTTVRVSQEVIDRADDLMPDVWKTDLFREAGLRRSRNSLLLIALDRGLAQLESEYHSLQNFEPPLETDSGDG